MSLLRFIAAVSGGVGLALLVGLGALAVTASQREKRLDCEAYAETIAIEQACVQQVDKCLLTTGDLRELVKATDGIKRCDAKPAESL